MPNMVDDGFLDQAFFVRLVSNTPPNLDYQLQNAVGSAVGAAAVQGLFTCTVNVSAYSGNNYALVILMIERLVNMGYTASLATSTLTVNWSVA
jgi:hypothetical protein